MLAALVALSLALDAPAAEGGAKFGPDRFRLLAPWENPGFVKDPVPPPDKNYGVAFAEVVLIDTSIWAFNYIRGKEFAIGVGREQFRREFGVSFLGIMAAPDRRAGS